MFTACTEHDSRTINKIMCTCFNRDFKLNSQQNLVQHTSISWDLETLENWHDSMMFKNSILTHQGSLFMDLPPISKKPHFFHNLHKNRSKEIRLFH